MPPKTYSEQFKRDAVALYESTEGASLKSTAAELGINRNTLKAWVARFSSNPRAGSADWLVRGVRSSIAGSLREQAVAHGRMAPGGRQV